MHRAKETTVAENKTSEQLTEESLELTRALTELREWSTERKRVLDEYEGYIQRALSQGKMTKRRSPESSKKYLSERMVATIALDCSMFKRSILMMTHRERQILKRLAEIAGGEASATAASSIADEEKSA
jgi:hypothetical protein